MTELLIVIVLFSVGILAVGALQVVSVKGNFNSNNLTQATYVARDRLESLKVLSFDSASLIPGSYTDTPVQASGVTYNRRYVVALNGTRKTITYTVTWNDGVNHTVAISTIRAQ